MVYLFLNWLVSTLGLAMMAAVIPGFRIEQFQSLLAASAVVGLFHAAVSAVFSPAPGEGAVRVWAVVVLIADTLVFRVVAFLVPGFAMLGFYPAFAGGLLLLLLNAALLRLLRQRPGATHSVADA